MPDLSPQSLPARAQARDPKHSTPIAIHIYDRHSLFRLLAILQGIVLFIDRSQSGGRKDALVFVVGENVVDFGVVVFARDGIFDEREEGFEVRWCCCWGGGGVDVFVFFVVVVFVVLCCWFVGSRVPGG